MSTLSVSIIAAAALSIPFAVLGTAAHASDALSFYGHAHVSANLVDDSEDTNLGLSSNSSRLGLKGKMALDQGYTVFYQAEWHVGLSGEKDWGQRNRFLGMKGEFGQLRLGRIDTPVKKLGRSVDLFWSSQLGENRSLTAKSGFDSRYNNGIVYSKKMGDYIKLTGAYYADAKDDDRIDNNDGSVFSSSVTYSNETFMLGAGYELVNGDEGTAAAEAEAAAETPPGIATPVEDASALRLVGSMKTGAHRFVGFYEVSSDVGGTDGKDGSVIGAGWAMTSGKHTYKAQAYMMEEYDNADDTGGTLIALGMDCQHTKQVTSYITLGMVSNDDEASFAIIGVGHDDKIAVTTGESNAGLSIGTRVKF